MLGHVFALKCVDYLDWYNKKLVKENELFLDSLMAHGSISCRFSKKTHIIYCVMIYTVFLQANKTNN